MSKKFTFFSSKIQILYEMYCVSVASTLLLNRAISLSQGCGDSHRLIQTMEAILPVVFSRL